MKALALLGLCGCFSVMQKEAPDDWSGPPAKCDDSYAFTGMAIGTALASIGGLVVLYATAEDPDEEPRGGYDIGGKSPNAAAIVAAIALGLVAQVEVIDTFLTARSTKTCRRYNATSAETRRR